jgi:hypothetical protein
VHIYRDEFDDAVGALDTAADLCQRIGDKPGEALSIAMRATVSRVQGHYAPAARRGRRALGILAVEGNRHLATQLWAPWE